MALTRKMLKAYGIEDEQIDQIIEAHTESTDALKADRDKYKEQAEKLSDEKAELQKKNDALVKENNDLTKDNEELQTKVDADNSYKEKYEKEREAFEEFKKGVDTEHEKAKKADAYKRLLKEAGVSDKRIDTIMKVSVTDNIEFDDEGKVKDSDKIVEHIKEEWSEFIVKESTKGAGTETPPAKDGKDKMTIEEIDAIEDTAERQKAMAENHELYGI